MAGLRAGFLPSYNSLTDKHLVGYFNKERIRQHLQRSGLISRSGRIIPEKEYQLNAVRKENQRYIQECLAQAVFHKLLDMEQHHQLEIKRKPENSVKKKREQKIKVKQFRRLVEDASLMHSPHPPSGPRNHQRLHPSVSGEPPGCSQARPPGPVVDRNGGRPSRPHQSKQPAFPTMTSLRPNTTPGNTQHPLRLQPLSSSAAVESVPKTLSSKQKCRALEHDEQIASGEARSELRLMDSVEHATGTAPCQLPVLNNYMIPVPPPPREKGDKNVNATRKGMPSWRRFRPATAPNDGNQLSTKSSGGFPKSPLRSNAFVTMVFLGKSVRLRHGDADCRDEIKVYQQHCGGENLCVYKGELLEGETFQFISKRHHGFPFSVTFFLNGIPVERLSCCCEHRNLKRSRLGGRPGYFRFLRVEGASPCYRCLFAMGPEGKPSLPTRKMEDHVGLWRDGVCSEPSKSRVVQKPRKDSVLVISPGHAASVKTLEAKMETAQEYRKEERKKLSDSENEDGQEDTGKNEYDEDFEEDEKVNEEGQTDDQMNGMSKSSSADEAHNLDYEKESKTSSQKALQPSDSEKDKSGEYSDSDSEDDEEAPDGAFLAEGTGTLDAQKTAEQVVEEGQMVGERQALEKEDVVAEGGDARTKEAGEMAQVADLLPKEDTVAVVQAEEQLAVEDSAPEESAMAEEDAKGKATGEEKEAGTEVAPGEREGLMEGRESKAAVGEEPAGAVLVPEADGVASEGEEEVAGEVSEGEEAVEEAPEAKEAVGVTGPLLKEEVGEVVPEAEEATEEGGFAGKGLVVGAVSEEKPGALLETLWGMNLCPGEAMPGEGDFVKPDEFFQLKAAEEEQLEMGQAATGAATSAAGKVSEAEGSSLLRAEDAGEESAEPGKGPVLQVAPELEVGAGGDPIKEGSSCLEKTTAAETEEGSAEALLSGNPSLGSRDETESTMEEKPDGWVMGTYAEKAGAESGGGGPVACGQGVNQEAVLGSEGRGPAPAEAEDQGEVGCEWGTARPVSPWHGELCGGMSPVEQPIAETSPSTSVLAVLAQAPPCLPQPAAAGTGAVEGKDGLQEGTEQAGVKDEGEQPGLLENTREGEVAGVPESERSAAWAREQRTDSPVGGSPDALGAADSGEKSCGPGEDVGNPDAAVVNLIGSALGHSSFLSLAFCHLSTLKAGTERKREYDEDFEEDEKVNEEGQTDDQMNGMSKSSSADEAHILDYEKESKTSSQKALQPSDSEKDKSGEYSDSDSEDDEEAPDGAFLAEGTGTLDAQKTAEQVVEEGQMVGERQALEKEDVVAEGGDARTKEAGEMAQVADLLPKEDMVAVVQAEEQLAVEDSAPEESAMAEEDAKGKATGEEKEAGTEVAPGEREGLMEGRESKAAVGEEPAGAVLVPEADGVASEGEEEVAGEVSEGEEAVEEAPEAKEAVGVTGPLLKEEVGEVVPEAEEATEEGGFAGKGLVVGAVSEEKPGALLETLWGMNLCPGEAMPGEGDFVKPDEFFQLKAAEEEQLEMGQAATGAATSAAGKVSEAEGSSLLRAEDAGEESAEPGKGPVLQVAPELEVGAGGDPIKEGSSCLEKTTAAETEEGSAEALLSGNPSLGSRDETESTMEEKPDGWVMGTYAEKAGAESGGGGPVACGQGVNQEAVLGSEGRGPAPAEAEDQGEVGCEWGTARPVSPRHGELCGGMSPVEQPIAETSPSTSVLAVLAQAPPCLPQPAAAGTGAVEGKDGLQEGTEQAGVKDEGEQPGLLENTREGEVAGVPESERSAAWAREQRTDSPVGGSPDALGAADSGEKSCGPGEDVGNPDAAVVNLIGSALGHSSFLSLAFCHLSTLKAGTERKREYDEDFEEDEKVNEEGQTDDQMNGMSKSSSADEAHNLDYEKESKTSSQKALQPSDSEKDKSGEYSDSDSEDDEEAPDGAFLAEGTGTLDAQKTAEQVVEEGQMVGERQALEKEDVVAEGGDARTKEAGEMAQVADLLPKEDTVAVVQAEEQLAVEDSAPEESAMAEEDAKGKATGEEKEAGTEVAPGEREGLMEGRESKAAVGEEPAGAVLVPEADGVASEGEEEVAGEVSEGEEAVEEAPEAKEAVGVTGPLLKEEVGEVVPEAEEATEEGGFAGKGLVVGAVSEEKPGALLETLWGMNLCPGEAMPGEGDFVKPDEFFQLKAAEEEQLEMGQAATGAATSAAGKVSEAEGSSLLRAEDAGEESAEPGKGPVLQVAPELEVGAGGDPIKEGSSCLEKTTAAETEEGSAEALLSGNPSLGSRDETESTMEEKPDGWVMGTYAEKAGAESGGGGPVACGQGVNQEAVLGSEGRGPAPAEAEDQGEVVCEWGTARPVSPRHGELCGGMSPVEQPIAETSPSTSVLAVLAQAPPCLPQPAAAGTGAVEGKDGLQEGTEQAGVKDEGEQPGLLENTREGEVAGVPESERSAAWAREQRTDSPVGGSPDALGAADSGEKSCGPGEDVGNPDAAVVPLVQPQDGEETLH